MGRPHSLRGRYQKKSTEGGSYDWYARFDTNGVSAPDAVMHSTDGLTYAYAAPGTYTVTWPAGQKPAEMIFGHAEIQEDKPKQQAAVSYNASTGVLTVYVYEEDGTSGISALADVDDVTIGVHCVFSRLTE